MAKKISEIDVNTTVLNYEETIDGVATTCTYWPLAKDTKGNVLVIRELLTTPAMGINATNDSTYINSNVDTWLNNTESGYLARFDENMRNCIMTSSVKVMPSGASEITEIARQVFLLSETEVGGSAALGEGESYLSAFLAHRNTTDANTARIGHNTAGYAQWWLLRSASSASGSWYVGSRGNVGTGSSADTGSPRPAFWVAADTMVSDATEDTIYILPDSTKLYRELEFTTYIGSSANRPKKAKVQVEITNATESTMQVSNNAKDASPVWATCENGGVAEFANTTKETDNWELGVKIYAKSSGRATVGEPALIVEVDA